MREKIASFKQRQKPTKLLGIRLNNWKMKADEFYRASEYLWIELSKDYAEILNRRKKEIISGDFKERTYTPSLYQPYFLLISLSIENLLKGIVLFNNPALLTDKLHHSIQTHDLVRISSFTDINFLRNEKEFFVMASTVIMWYSRYPIPNKANNIIQSANFNTIKIRETYLKLFFKLSDEMNKSGGLTQNYNYIFLKRSSRHLR
ncbi:MAG: hypothetical protein ACR2KX_11965 [Chitinophagaceae bacterium]